VLVIYTLVLIALLLSGTAVTIAFHDELPQKLTIPECTAIVLFGSVLWPATVIGVALYGTWQLARRVTDRPEFPRARVHKEIR
jgi:hypothetical protein